MQTLEYASLGLLGLLTPQANTTVEAEAWSLLPTGVGLVNGRLVSHHPNMEQRLLDYFGDLRLAACQFANAPWRVLALACTGSSYLMGRDAEQAWVNDWQDALGKPVVTAGRALVAALNSLGAKRIELVSPYTPNLTQASVAYWQSHGFEVVQVHNLTPSAQGFHPIYAVGAGSAHAALSGRATSTADAVLLLGTGMPTLLPLLQANQLPGPPVLSSMLALMWLAVSALHPQSLAAWLIGQHWAQRANLLLASPNNNGEA